MPSVLRLYATLPAGVGKRVHINKIKYKQTLTTEKIKINLSVAYATQKLKPHLLRTQRLKVLPLKPGVGQYIAILLSLIHI